MKNCWWKKNVAALKSCGLIVPGNRNGMEDEINVAHRRLSPINLILKKIINYIFVNLLLIYLASQVN